MDDARLFLCARCRRQVLICSRCDRGQQYCGARCSGLARRESLRAAGRRYQHSRRGRHCHAERQRRYRHRCGEDARAQKVTHHGSACAPCGAELAHQACRDGFSALYLRLPRLLHDFAIARGDGTYPKLLTSFAKLDLLVLDDFGLAKLNADHRRDLLELLEDRYATRSTLVTSQLPIEKWHDCLGDPTFADAILDRLVHNAYKLKLKGGSMRKKKDSLTQADH